MLKYTEHQKKLLTTLYGHLLISAVPKSMIFTNTYIHVILIYLTIQQCFASATKETNVVLHKQHI